MLTASRLSLGTAQFGFRYGIPSAEIQVSFPEVSRILSLGRECLINTIDTAIAYGTSEKVLGEAGIDGFQVVTKLPPLPVDRSDVESWVNEQVESSLIRLGQQSLHGLLLHQPKDLICSKSERLIQSLNNLKQKKVVKKIGISIYSPSELDMLYSKMKFDLVQAPLNVIDRRLHTSGWLDQLKIDGVEVHTRSTFLKGLLLLERSKIPEKFGRWSDLWDDWNQALKDSGVSRLVGCLTYPLSLNQIDKVLVGVNSAAQFRSILAATNALDDTLDTSFMESTDPNLLNPSNWDQL